MPAPLTWIDDLRRVCANERCVLVTLMIVSGSAPRESGSRMIVTGREILGSVGGGNLEFKAIEKARALLGRHGEGGQDYELYGLGPALNQCCGGAVALHFELVGQGIHPWLEQLGERAGARDPAVLVSAVDAAVPFRQVAGTGLPPASGLPADVREAAGRVLRNIVSTPGGTFIEIKSSGTTWWIETIREASRPLLLFGAGHVGQAVARALGPLPFAVRWIDSRQGVLHDNLPDNIHAVHADDPAAQVPQAPAQSIFVVMTHSHQLDEDICLEVLRRGDFSWLGLIGSATKRRRFVHRLQQRGAEPAALDRLVCPIGLPGIHGKEPATIALSLAAQLMTTGFASDIPEIGSTDGY
jgi:xanthine dehydrogenase accessory factor